MAKKEIKTTKAVKKVEPDFYVKISDGKFSVALSETKGKYDIKLTGVDKIETVFDLDNFKDVVENTLNAYFSSTEAYVDEECVGPCYAN